MEIFNRISIKLSVSVLLLILMTKDASVAQGRMQSKPEKVEIDKYALVTVLTDFIEDARSNSAFYEDKGVITLTACRGDSIGYTRYSLRVLIDSRYEDYPISKYAYFGNYVVLFDTCGVKAELPNKEEYFKDLNEEIGDRVYKRPTKKGRWMTYRTKEGKLISGMRGLSTITGGSGQQNDRVYIVDENNKFKKLTTL